VLIASTSEVYGHGTVLPFREDANLVLGAPTSMRWGYAASKLLDEFMALAYWKEHRVPVIVVRLFKVFDDTFEDMARRVPDIGKIHRLIGYTPRVHLEEILERVIQYWAEQPAGIAPGLVSTRPTENVSTSVARQMESVLAATA